MAMAAVFHSVTGLVFLPALTLSPGLIDFARFVRAYGVWVATTLVLLLLALPSARRGREGRWTVYVVIVLSCPNGFSRRSSRPSRRSRSAS